jgi:uncharacterized membrane protein YdbT with pleckstrin-like domain
MFDLNLNKHLNSNEKMVLFFRPSRKAYTLHYFLYAVLFIAAIMLLSYSVINGKTSILFVILFYFSLLFLIFVIILILRLEYRIFSRRYGLTEQRALYGAGIFSERFRSINYSYITDVGLYQNFWDKVMNTGTVKVDTAGTDEYEIRYRKVSDPYNIQKLINELSSKMPVSKSLGTHKIK